ncbi:MAG TPA: formate dehydrogenase subunit alpha [Deltaproteobacteria bacterium]|nr:formate dehydrogenase subunit alpha [Deltaproteobacteria bacterium]
MNLNFIKTICPYCGTGCGIILQVKGGRAVTTLADRSHPVSRGGLCIKGWTAHEFIHHPDRLTKPLLKKNGKFKELSWDEAIGLAADRLKETVKAHGPDAVASLSSARCTNEENYLFQKLIRAGLGTNNVDHCARLCHGPTAAAMAYALGSGAMTNSIADFSGAECILIIGSNAAETHPIIMGEIYKARDNGAVLVVVDPRRTEVANNADMHLQINSGTDIPLIDAMMKLILDASLENREFIASRTDGFTEMKEYLSQRTLEELSRECGIPLEDIRKVAELYARAREASIVFCMGITQHACGTSNVYAICNLALLCGHVGKPHSGICPLRGQNNVQGACDVGALPNVYPGYQAVADEKNHAKFAQAWGRDLSRKPGLTVTEIFAAAGTTVRTLYTMGENPLLSDPNQGHLMEMIPKLDFFIAQDLFMTETARYADLVLPAACYAEKTGTFTNTERRIQLLRKAVDPPGEAKDDFSILCLLLKAFGLKGDYADPSEVMDEIAALTPIMAGVHFDRLGTHGLQWPVPSDDHPGTRYLHKDTFTRGKGLFVVPKYTPPKEMPDENYPFVLNTGRMFSHYHTGTMTRRSPFLDREVDKPFVEIHPADAARLGIVEGGGVTVTTRRGSIETFARITTRVMEGSLFAPFHFSEAPANALTIEELDPDSKMPELKVCAARLEKG